MEDNVSIDNEIWVENRIEESKQEIQDIIEEKIKALNYEKTIESLQQKLEKLNKDIAQVNYEKDRKLENLVEDISLKFDDIDIANQNFLEQKIYKISESNLLDLKNKVENIDKNSQAIKNATEKDIDSLKDKIEGIDKYSQEKIDITVNDLCDLKNKIENIDKNSQAIKNATEKDIVSLKDKIEGIDKYSQEKIDITANDLSDLKNKIDLINKNSHEILGATADDINNLKNCIDNLYKNSQNIKEQIVNEQENKISYLKNDIVQIINEIKAEGEDKIQEQIEQYKQETADQINKQKSEINKIVESISEEINNACKANNNETLTDFFEQRLEGLKEELIKKIEIQNKELTSKILKIKGINAKRQLQDISSEIDIIANQLQRIPGIIEEANEQHFKEVENYVESRILRLKYAMTIQDIYSEITEMKSRIDVLEKKKKNSGSANDDEASISEDSSKINNLEELVRSLDIEPIKSENSLYAAAKKIEKITKKKNQILNDNE